MSRARGRTVGAPEPFPLASGLTCDCKPGSAAALFGSVSSRRSLARTSGRICIAYCSFVGPATESANVVLSGGSRSCLSGCFFRRPGLTRRKGDRSRIARRFLLSSVRKRKMRRRLGPAAGSRPQSVCSEIGVRHCAGERLCRDVRRFCPYAFGPVAGSAGQRKKIAEYDIRIPFRHRSGRSLCGGGRAEAEDFRRVSVQVRVQKTRRQKTLPPRAFRSAVARRCGYFLEERYSFTTL